jgi:UDP-N-acetylglucosamine--N-acetylmuramyl-(pentapeptide) pyrophosphoryl-undecaprenol N-acetylglucosamine transferase
VKVVLTGGGTGGHIYPALSVARCLSEDEVLYVGTADGPEATIVPRAGVPFRSVPSRKLSRRPTPGAVLALGVSAWGIVRAAGLLRGWKPDVVLGTGGYASAGVMFAAALLRIPTVVHEANVIPGRVNRLLARLCTRVAITYRDSAACFPSGKTVLTGMPVRPDLLQADPGRARTTYRLDVNLPTLLVCGGSGGAQTLNRGVVEALPQLGSLSGEGPQALRLQVVHQTGKAHYDSVLQAAGGYLPPFYHPVAYVEDMPSLLAAGTIIVCRGGSSTLAEVTAVGLPAIVVPYPYAVADHQTYNARSLAEAGAAVMVKDGEFTGDRLVREVRALLSDAARLEAMRAASRSQGRPDAAQRVADLLSEVAANQRRPARNWQAAA